MQIYLINQPMLVYQCALQWDHTWLLKRYSETILQSVQIWSKDIYFLNSNYYERRLMFKRLWVWTFSKERLLCQVNSLIAPQNSDFSSYYFRFSAIIPKLMTRQDNKRKDKPNNCNKWAPILQITGDRQHDVEAYCWLWVIREHWRQCDQIGWFLEVFGNKVTCISVPNI